jgi:hypothetical protein
MHSHHIAAQAAISEARAHLWAAVKIGAGRRAMEGDIERADSRLQSAREWLRGGDDAEALDEIAAAIELLRTEESRFIAEDPYALDDAIRVLQAMRWDY